MMKEVQTRDDPPLVRVARGRGVYLWARWQRKRQTPTCATADALPRRRSVANAVQRPCIVAMVEPY
jgi:hypothetical protein